VLRPILLTFAWIVAVTYATIPAYWFIVHPFAARWRALRRPFRFILPLWFLAFLLAAGATYPFAGTQLYDGWSVRIAGAILILLAAAVYRAVGGERFTGAQLVGRSEVETGQEQRLVAEGMHARVRHPIYLAGLLMLLGWTVASGLLAAYLLLAWVVAAGAVMIRLEESELIQRFGDSYRDYRRRVPAIIPKVG
jgi:protein-S-isoprenylcysteine O-methyltransferase Ste14